MNQAQIRALPLRPAGYPADNDATGAGEGEMIRSFIRNDMLSAVFQPIID